MAPVRQITIARREATNPFRYGGVVDENAFCNRKQELADLLRTAVNSEELLLYSERRLGKTSLIRLMMKKLPAKFVGVYVDLLPTDNEAAFSAVTAKALSEALSTTADKPSALRADGGNSRLGDWRRPKSFPNLSLRWRISLVDRYLGPQAGLCFGGRRRIFVP